MQRKSTVPLLAFAFAALISIGAARAGAEVSGPVEAINADAKTATIIVHRLRGHYSVLEGSGGNIGVLTGPHMVTLIDTGISLSQPRISEAIHTLSTAPLKYVIDTHWHWDHTDGNGWAHAAGATIIAHANVLKRLSGSNHVDEWNHTFTPAPLAARPTVLVSDRKTLHVDGATLKLKYYGLAHTDGDISVYDPEANILQTGDTWWNGYYPMIDYGAGGSIDGMIRAANINIALANEKTIVVPGHGPVGNRDELVAYRDMLVAIRNNVAKLKQSGMTLPQIIAAKPTAAFDQKWGGFVIGPDLFTSLVYRGL